MDNIGLPETTKPRHHWDARGFLDKLGFRETLMWSPTGIESASENGLNPRFLNFTLSKYPQKYPLNFWM
jgi:hypothetical protein